MLFKSSFSRLHFCFVIFTALNIGLGLALALVLQFPSYEMFVTAANLHFISGILIFLFPLIFSIFIKDRKNAWKAMKARFLINKQLYASKNRRLIFSKLVAWLFAVCLVAAFAGGVFVKTGITGLLFPDMNFLLFHTRLKFILPVLLIIHIVSMKTSYRGKLQK